jgi:hypothetical protein
MDLTNSTYEQASTMERLPLNEVDRDLDEDLEPSVLSYTQFRNQLGLLEWRRRRAAYENGAQTRTVAPRRGGGAAGDPAG